MSNQPSVRIAFSAKRHIPLLTELRDDYGMSYDTGEVDEDGSMFFLIQDLLLQLMNGEHLITNFSSGYTTPKSKPLYEIPYTTTPPISQASPLQPANDENYNTPTPSHPGANLEKFLIGSTIL
ncbi:hypothetical protein YC2023_058012 [Brassica napus]